MKTHDLILWRHAEAEDIGPEPSDASRRLTTRGLRQAERMATWLNRHLPAETSILVSPATRTRQTADALARPYQVETNLFTDCSANDYLTAACWQQVSTQTCTLVIGHQPTLGEVAALLMCGHPLPWSVKKGAIWWLRHQGVGQPARLVCVLDPQTLDSTYASHTHF